MKCLILHAVVVITVIAIIIFTSKFWLRKIGYWLQCEVPMENMPDKSDALVVLAGDGIIRTKYGVDLYLSGHATELWITGNIPLPDLPSFSEGTYAFQFAKQSGVPVDSIFLLSTESTWEDGQETIHLAKKHNIKSILVITSWYHLRRAKIIMRYHFTDSNIKVDFCHPIAAYNPDNWWKHEDGLVLVLGELTKLAFYWARYKLPPWEK